MNTIRAALLSIAGVLLGCSSSSSSGDPAAPGGVALDPPAHGVQLHVARFDVAPSTEVQRCHYFKNTSDVDLDIVRLETSMTVGSHHVSLYQTDVDHPDHDESCFALSDIATPENPGGFRLMFNVARQGVKWDLPPGVAIPLKAHQQLMMQVHFVNATTQTTPEGAEVYWNLVAEPDASKIQAHMGVLSGSNTTLKILPRSSPSFDEDCTIDEPVSLVAAAGHFHSRGREFDMFAAPDGQTFDAKPFYVSRDWADAPFAVYGPPTPLAAGSKLRFRCSYDNPSDDTFLFGPHVETEEHCIANFYVYPWDATKRQTCAPATQAATP